MARRAERGRPVTDRVMMAVPLLKVVALVLRKFPSSTASSATAHSCRGPAPSGSGDSLRQGGLIAPAIRDADKLGSMI